MMIFVTLLLVANVGSLAYVFRAKIREFFSRTVYIYEFGDAPQAPQAQTHHRTDSTRLAIYHEILAALHLDDLRCTVGAYMLARQSEYMRGVLLTTGLRPFVAQLKKTDDEQLHTYLEGR